MNQPQENNEQAAAAQTVTRPDAKSDLLSKPPATAAGTLEISSVPVPTTISVNIGVQGKMKKLILDSNATVGDAIRAAQFDAQNMDIRMGGRQVTANTPLVNGATIMLLRAVKGNN